MRCVRCGLIIIIVIIIITTGSYEFIIIHFSDSVPGGLIVRALD